MDSEVGRTTVRAITNRVMPLFCIMYFVAYIDRQNISYAKLQMADALRITEAGFGLGSALFFIGYVLFEVPSNILLSRVGARVWFARIMVTWGLITIALGFAHDVTLFYALRLLLGVAEAGFFPGVLYTLTLWYPSALRGRMVGAFMIASAVANAVGAVAGGALLDLNGALGLQGWQWVFLATGIPACLLAPYVLLKLPNSPSSANWLTADQKAWLNDALVHEGKAVIRSGRGEVWRAMIDRRVLLLAAVYIGLPLGAYGLSYWLPTIVRDFGVSTSVNGLLNVIPWTLVGVALWLVPRHATKHGVTRWYIAGSAFIAAAGLVLSVVLPGATLKFAMLCVAAPAIFGAQPVFWSLPPTLLRGPEAAIGIAVINSMGNFGGFIALTIVPVVRDLTGSNLYPLLVLASCLAVAGVLAIFIVPRVQRDIDIR